MYETYEHWDVFGTHTMRISFSLTYRDWCRLEKSKVFQELIAYLEEVEKQKNKIELQEPQD